MKTVANLSASTYKMPIIKYLCAMMMFAVTYFAVIVYAFFVFYATWGWNVDKARAC